MLSACLQHVSCHQVKLTLVYPQLLQCPAAYIIYDVDNPQRCIATIISRRCVSIKASQAKDRVKCVLCNGRGIAGMRWLALTCILPCRLHACDANGGSECCTQVASGGITLSTNSGTARVMLSSRGTIWWSGHLTRNPTCALACSPKGADTSILLFPSPFNLRTTGS